MPNTQQPEVRTIRGIRVVTITPLAAEATEYCGGCPFDKTTCPEDADDVLACGAGYFRPAPPEPAEPGTTSNGAGSNEAPAVTAGTAGRKDDSGKLDITLLFDDMPHALEAVTEVLQWAITKKQPVPYRRGSWQGVEPFHPRYRAAQLRHQIAAAKAALTGQVSASHLARDWETGLLELAHIATDALFQLEMACRELSCAASNAQ